MAEDRSICTLEVETDGKSRTIALEGKVVSFGRSRKCTVVLREDAKISSQHCQVVRQDAGWVLVDLGSKNKTFLNGDAVSSSSLKHGDSFKIGMTTVTFRVGAPKALDPKEAEKLLGARPSTNTREGAEIAAALASPARPAPQVKKKPEQPGKSVKVQRGSGKGTSMFALACFFAAGILSGVTALLVFDNRDEDPALRVAKKVEQKVEMPADPGAGEISVRETPADPAVPPTEVPVAPAEPPVDTAVEVPAAPPEEVVVQAPDPAPEPAKEPVKEPETVAAETAPPVVPLEPLGQGDDGTPKPPDPEVAVDPDPPPGTEVTDEPNRPPTQFMGLETKIRRVVYVMDITGSMEDPATSTPKEFTGPPSMKIGGELKRQLDKFGRKDVRTKLDAAKYELVHSIAYLPADVEFTVIFYSFSPTPWQKRFVTASEKNKIDAIKRVKTTAAWGGTNIYDALEMSFSIIDDHIKAQKPDPKTGTRAKATGAYAIFLVTDGKHNTGRYPDPEEFLREIKKLNADGRAVINAIGVGEEGKGLDPPDPVFLHRLASENGGEARMAK